MPVRRHAWHYRCLLLLGTGVVMTIDRKLQEQVLAALEWEPGVEAAHVGVAVADGVVTLYGTAPSFRQKWLAERAARHVPGVRAIANDLEIEPVRAARTDAVVAEAVANALEWDSGVPDGCVQATVRHGWVVLNGSVPWDFQSKAAERAVERVQGVKGVANSIVVRPQVQLDEVRSHITSALDRDAHHDAERIHIEAHDGTVILTGTVHSLSERQSIEEAVRLTPGVTRVDDRLSVAL